MILCGIVFAAAALLWLLRRKKLPEHQAKMLLALSAAAALGLAAGATEEAGGTLQEEGALSRNGAGEGAYEETLQLDAGDLLKEYDYTVTVPEQVLTAAEEEKLLEQAKTEIEAEFLGENKAFSDVQKKVAVREAYQEGLVEARWEFDKPEVIDDNGEIIAEELPEEGILVQAAVELTCGTSGCCYEFLFLVKPSVLSEREQLLKEVNDYLTAQTGKPGEEKLTLPENIGGKTLQWSKKKEHLPEKILALGFVIAAAIPLIGVSRKQEAEKKREEQLLLEYPDMVSKLALLMGAGMTLFGAWKKIASEYQNKRKNNSVSERISCEEMLYTCHEVEGGIGEGQAYERFGERCGAARYRKLGNTLSQNLRKGNRGLLDLLESEVDEAFEERKSIARKYGEEAGTKLLFPMMIMLVMIMALLLIPALLAFQV